MQTVNWKWVVLGALGIVPIVCLWSSNASHGNDDEGADPEKGDTPEPDRQGGSMGNAAIIATLRGSAKAAATELDRAYPQCVMTSGLRSADAQAQADAKNCFSNPEYLKLHSGAVKDRLQAALTALGSSPSQDAIYQAFVGILGTASTDELSHYSKHVSGDAFDVGPNSTKKAMPGNAAAVLTALDSMMDQHISNGGAGAVLRPPKDPAWHWQSTGPVATYSIEVTA